MAERRVVSLLLALLEMLECMLLITLGVWLWVAAIAAADGGEGVMRGS